MKTARFIWTYESSDYGTERTLTVYDGERIIGQADPFWPAGVPVDADERKAALRRAAQAIVRKYLAAA